MIRMARTMIIISHCHLVDIVVLVIPEFRVNPRPQDLIDTTIYPQEKMQNLCQYDNN